MCSTQQKAAHWMAAQRTAQTLIENKKNKVKNETKNNQFNRSMVQSW